LFHGHVQTAILAYGGPDHPTDLDFIVNVRNDEGDVPNLCVNFLDYFFVESFAWAADEHLEALAGKHHCGRATNVKGLNRN